MRVHPYAFVNAEITVTDDNGAAWTRIEIEAGGDILQVSLSQNDALALAAAISEAVYGEDWREIAPA